MEWVHAHAILAASLVIGALVAANVFVLLCAVHLNKKINFPAPTGYEATAKLLAREDCDCPCHTRSGKASMMPGMRCIDCINEPCDEGTM